MIKWSLLFSLFFVFNFSYAQQDSIKTGRVTDSIGNPLIGVVIKNLETQKIVESDKSGDFKIFASANNRLEFTYVGYLSKIINSFTGGNVILEAKPTGLNEVVVIGYGTQRKRDITGAISTINSNNMTLGGPVTNVGQAIQGRASGVLVRQTSNAPGAGLSIVIRGGNSISTTNAPLYVVDGFISANGAIINPNDIDDIQILKDASATAIYGSRGANGVVMITTKKGKAGKTIVEGNFSHSSQSLTYHPERIDGQQYQNVMNALAVENSTAPPFGSSFPTTNTDWYKLATQSAKIDNGTVSISSGGKDSKLYVSLDYFKQGGVLKQTNFNRYSARIGGEKSAGDHIKFGGNVYAASSSSDLQSYSNGITAPLYSVLTYGTNIPVFNTDGSYYRYLGKDNPIATLMEKTNNEYKKLFNGNIYLDYSFMKNLTYHIDAGGEYTQTTDGQYVPNTLVAGAADGGLAAQQNYQNERWLVQQYLTYKLLTNKHSLTAMIGTSNQKDIYQYLTAGSKGYSSDIFLYNNLGAGTTSYPAPTSYKEETKLTSYFGRLNYAYNDKLLATFTIRKDGSSRFGSNNKWGYFPSGALAYRFDNESFMESLKLSNLKIRASYGLTGNDQITNYQYMSQMTNYNVVLSESGNLSGGIEPKNLANPSLKWEPNSQFDAGLDIGILKNKVNITFDYYRKKTSDMLLSTPIGAWWGFNSQIINVGKLLNQGLELSVNTTNISKNDFTWSTTINGAYNKQKILELAPSVTTISFTTANPSGVVSGQEFTRLVPGKELGLLYGYKYLGVIKTGEKYAAQPNSKPGDPKYADLNNDGKIDANDRTFLGNTNPHYMLGVTNSLTYKGFDLNIFFQGAFDYKLYNMNRLVMESTTGKDILNRWVANKNENTDVPRDGYFKSTYGSYVNSRFVENASYLRLKQLTIGYTVPAKILEKTKFFESVRIYFSANNLITFTGYKGTDPEANANSSSNIGGGLDFNGFPAYKTFIGGLKIAFH